MHKRISGHQQFLGLFVFLLPPNHLGRSRSPCAPGEWEGHEGPGLGRRGPRRAQAGAGAGAGRAGLPETGEGLPGVEEPRAGLPLRPTPAHTHRRRLAPLAPPLLSRRPAASPPPPPPPPSSLAPPPKSGRAALPLPGARAPGPAEWVSACPCARAPRLRLPPSPSPLRAGERRWEPPRAERPEIAPRPPTPPTPRILHPRKAHTWRTLAPPPAPALLGRPSPGRHIPVGALPRRGGRRPLCPKESTNKYK